MAVRIQACLLKSCDESERSHPKREDQKRALGLSLLSDSFFRPVPSHRPGNASDCSVFFSLKKALPGYDDETTDQVLRGKPDPALIFTACKQLDVDPHDVVLIGDTHADVEAGSAAGCPVIGVNVTGDFTVSNLREIVDLLDV